MVKWTTIVEMILLISGIVVVPPIILILESEDTLDNPNEDTPVHPSNGTSIEISSYLQLLALDFPGSGTPIDPFIISDIILIGGIALQIRDIDTYVQVKNVKFDQNKQDNQQCVLVENSRNIEFHNNDFHCNGIALNVISSSQMTITNNTISSGSVGVLLTDTNDFYIGTNNFMNFTGASVQVYQSNDGYLIENYANSVSLDGIYIFECEDIFVEDNIVVRSERGLFVRDSQRIRIGGNTASNGEYGLIIQGSSFNIIAGNSLSYYGTTGILLELGSNNNNIDYNVVGAIGFYAIEIRQGDNNTISLNDFQGAGFSGNIGYDAGLNNNFDNNYWQDGNDTVLLNGGSNADFNPLEKPSHINSVVLVVYAEDGNFISEGTEIIWSVDDNDNHLILFTLQYRYFGNTTIEIFYQGNNTDYFIPNYIFQIGDQVEISIVYEDKLGFSGMLWRSTVYEYI